MKVKRLCSCLLLVCMLATTISAYAVEADGFVDVDKNSNLYGAVKLLNNMGIIEGVGDNRYAPNMTVSRADFAVIVDKAFKFEKTIFHHIYTLYI